MSDVIDFELPEDCDRKITVLFEYWRSIHPGPGHPGYPNSGLPARSDFDPLDLSPDYWPNISLIDVTKDPLRFRMRLVGTEIVRFKKCDETGQWLDELNPGFVKCAFYEMLRTCALAGTPGYGKNVADSEGDGAVIKIERICLPLASDGVNVDMLLLLMNYHDNRKGRRARAL